AIHSIIMATHTPVIPNPNVIPKIYPRITRNDHIVIKEEIKVKFESPAARNAEGIIKLADHKNGCAIAANKTSKKIVGIISPGGLNILIISGYKGNKIKLDNTK